MTSTLVTRDGPNFYRNHQIFRYLGFNSYDLVVSMPTQGEIQTRLQQIVATGATVVRLWAFGETTQATAQFGLFQYGATGGQWNLAAFEQLDYVLSLGPQYNVVFSLPLVNNWSAYGGKATYAQYYNTANNVSTYVADNFHDTPGIIALYKAYIAYLLGRTNTVTGIPYSEDPSIFGWECINEGSYRIGTDTNPNTLQSARIQTMTAWYSEISAYIKSLDPNHLVGTGSISQAYDYISSDPFHAGSYAGLDFLSQHALPTIDYCDWHLYPAHAYNTSGSDCTLLWTSAAGYHAQISQCIGWAKSMPKPFVSGEIGIDKRNTVTTPVVFYPRSQYFSALFEEIFSQNASGALLWNYDNPLSPDNNYGVDAGVITTDPTVPAANVSDLPLLNAITAQNLLLTEGAAAMATITPTNALALADSIAAHIIAAEGLLVSPTALESGQTTTLAKVAALNDAGQLLMLLGAFQNAVNNELAWITNNQAYTTLLTNWIPACAALDQVTQGYSAFLATNLQQVDPHFLDAFNAAVVKGLQYPQTPLANWQAFGPAQTDLAEISVTGSGVGTFAAGTALSTYGNAPLSVYNAGSAATGAAAGTYTVTYNSYTSAGVLQTGLTANATVPAATAVGASVALNVSGIAVTTITVSGGNAGDIIGVKSTLLRTVTY